MSKLFFLRRDFFDIFFEFFDTKGNSPKFLANELLQFAIVIPQSSELFSTISCCLSVAPPMTLSKSMSSSEIEFSALTAAWADEMVARPLTRL